jgi:hypothetical protein
MRAVELWKKFGKGMDWNGVEPKLQILSQQLRGDTATKHRITVRTVSSGFGGLVVQTQPKPLHFSGRKNTQHAFLRRGSNTVCSMSQLCGLQLP